MVESDGSDCAVGRMHVMERGVDAGSCVHVKWSCDCRCLASDKQLERANEQPYELVSSRLQGCNSSRWPCTIMPDKHKVIKHASIDPFAHATSIPMSHVKISEQVCTTFWFSNSLVIVSEANAFRGPFYHIVLNYGLLPRPLSSMARDKLCVVVPRH